MAWGAGAGGGGGNWGQEQNRTANKQNFEQNPIAFR